MSTVRMSSSLQYEIADKAKRMFDVVGHYSRPNVFNFKINQPNKN